MKTLLFFLAITSLKAANADCQACYDALVGQNTLTTAFVCAPDGNTFINECFALCNGYTAADLIEGKCIQNRCLGYYYPVCTNQGTYANECEARHYYATIIYPGECRRGIYYGNLGNQPLVRQFNVVVPEQLLTGSGQTATRWP